MASEPNRNLSRWSRSSLTGWLITRAMVAPLVLVTTVHNSMTTAQVNVVQRQEETQQQTPANTTTNSSISLGRSTMADYRSRPRCWNSVVGIGEEQAGKRTWRNNCSNRCTMGVWKNVETTELLWLMLGTTLEALMLDSRCLARKANLNHLVCCTRPEEPLLRLRGSQCTASIRGMLICINNILALMLDIRAVGVHCALWTYTFWELVLGRQDLRRKDKGKCVSHNHLDKPTCPTVTLTDYYFLKKKREARLKTIAGLAATITTTSSSPFYCNVRGKLYNFIIMS
jgi:hypothetical protein